MSYPILYSATESDFSHNGLGILGDCVSCEVTEEANGIFELAMQYPMDGLHFAEIGDRAIIKAKADQFREPQLFRVYAISKPMSGIVTVLAEHISYDLSGIPVKPFSADIVALAIAGLKTNAVVDCPFDFWTDKSTSGKFSVPTPASIRSRLGGVDGSILDVYGGEYEFDNYTVKLHNNRGMNRGVSIRYGKNLTDIKQEQNCASVATGVYPYWAGTVDEKDVLVELPERIVNAPGTYNFVKIRTVDFTQNFETRPTVEQLRSATENYIKNNNIGVPSVSLTVSFAQLEQTEEYKHLKLLERVSLFDTVNVEFLALGVSATAKAVKMVYDVIADRVKSVTLGYVRANIADTIATQQKEIDYSKDKPTLSTVQKISSALAKAIMGADGGAVRLIDTNDDGEPDELYIADNADPTKALKVWRFNYNGWAASKNGYSGPFEFGATLEEGLLANFVTAAHLVAGTIKSADSGETFFLDLDNGILNMNATSLNISGKTVDDIAQGKVNAQTQEDIFNKLTNNGLLQGLYMQDDDLYINADYLVTGILRSKNGDTFYLNLDNGVLKGKFQELSISGKTVDTIAQEKANAAEGNAKTYADTAASNAVSAQTQTDIFNKLTNNGVLPGLFMLDGQMYINADYIQSGTIDASVVNVINLIAEKVKSVKGDQNVEIDGGKLEFYIAGVLYAALNSDPIFGGASLGMYSYKDGATAVTTEIHGSGFYAESNEEVFGITNLVQIGIDPETGVPYADLPRLNDMKVYWEPNGDGTFTLKGMEA